MKSLRRWMTADDSGMTLAELLVVSVLLGVVFTAAYMLLNTVTAMSDSVEARSVAASESRLFIDRFTREMREAGEAQEGMGVFLRAQPRWCEFYSDVDHDGVPEKVTYRVVGQSLYRSQAEAVAPVPPYRWGAESRQVVVVKSLKGGWSGNVFEYYDREDPPNEVNAGHPEDISAVKLWLVNGATVGKRTSFVDTSTWVKVRSIHNTIE